VLQAKYGHAKVILWAGFVLGLTETFQNGITNLTLN
jgi:hypothetical protein